MRFSQTITIGGREVGPGRPCFVIAEAGVAHFGDMGKARRLVDMAAAARADVVKFQVFRTEELVSAAAPDWRRRLKSRELPFEAFREIQAWSREAGIPFCATAHDEPSLDFLADLDVPCYKIGSGEVENWPFLARVARLGRPVILSTGMYTLEQVGRALEVMAGEGNRDVIVLHCVTRYPTPPDEVNLKAMDAIRERFDVVVGYSDHTEGIHFPLAAVARGASVIEKHISLDFDVPDAQDWRVSCDAASLAELVRQIRAVEAGLGSGEKAPGEGERRSLEWARKSLVAARAIGAGAVITRDMLVARRPGLGIPPARVDELVGRRTARAVEADRPLSWEDLE